MKRIALIFITLTICLIAFSGCANIRYKGPLSCTRYDGENDGLETITEIDITEDVAEKIISILNSAQWNNETMNTVGYHYQFELRNATIVYHFKAGLLIDVTNGRNACLDFSTWARLNKLIGVTQERITLGKDISGAVIYTIADALKLKAFKRQKYQCVNLAGRAFTTYLDDVPAKMMWADGRVAEVYKEDKLYTVLNEITTPGIEYISALVIKASEVFCFYGDGVQLADAGREYERLKQEQEVYLQEKSSKKIGSKEKILLPTIPKFHLPGKAAAKKTIELTDQDDEASMIP